MELITIIATYPNPDYDYRKGFQLHDELEGILQVEQMSFRIKRDYRGICGGTAYFTGLTDCLSHDEFLAKVPSLVCDKWSFELLDDIPEYVIDIHRYDDQKLNR